MRRFLTWCICIVFLFGNTVYAKKVEEPKDLYAQAAVLMDADSGRILFGKNADKVLAMASTTKIMTCILALEKGEMDTVVTASENASLQPKVHLGMQTGEQFYLKDLLYSLMLESHNDSAVAIAEHIGGSVEGFADFMNEKAKELGCENTYFITPNGLDAEDEKGKHATSAMDLARIMSYCIMESPKSSEFLSITATPVYQFQNLKGSRSYACSNRNAFLTMMEGAISGKTGFTSEAGYCYVGALKRDERTFVVALLACGWPNNKNYKWKDSLKLMEYAIENYTYREVENEMELPALVVEEGVPNNDEMFESAYVKLKMDTNEDIRMLLRTDENVEIKTEIKKKLKAPVTAEYQVGYVVYYLNGEIVEKIPVVTTQNVKKKDLAWCFKKIAQKYFCFQ